MNENLNLFKELEPGAGIWTVNTDGACRGNPGPGGAGVVVKDADGAVLAELSRSLGRTTNNEAEYQALILGLEEAARLGARRLEVRMDSELAVRQLTGVYRVKNERLLPLYQRAKALLARFEGYEIVHVRRELNAEADSLASRAAKKSL